MRFDSTGRCVMQTTRLADGRAVVAPDGSQIHELVAVARGSMVHSRGPPGPVRGAGEACGVRAAAT